MSNEHLLTLHPKQNVFLSLSKEQLTEELKTFSKYALTNETGLSLLEAVINQLEPQVAAFGTEQEVKHKVECLFPYNDHMEILHIVRDGVAKTVTVYFAQAAFPDDVLTHVFDNNFMALKTFEAWPKMTRQELYDLIVAEAQAKIFNPGVQKAPEEGYSVTLNLRGVYLPTKFHEYLGKELERKYGLEKSNLILDAFCSKALSQGVLKHEEKETKNWVLRVEPDLSMGWEWKTPHEEKTSSTSL